MEGVRWQKKTVIFKSLIESSWQMNTAISFIKEVSKFGVRYFVINHIGFPTISVSLQTDTFLAKK